jgi:exodeoxyribonuclease III
VRVATWNVNGIRARESQVRDWIARDRPDVVCLQEIKAKPEQIPEMLFESEGYWCYWHGAGGYSGVALHVRKELCADRPCFGHPEFDHETRIVAADVAGVTIASVYVPNGGKDYGAKLRFLESLEGYARAAKEAGREILLCGDLNVARTDQDVHPKERKAGAVGQREDERALFEGVLGQGLVDVGRSLDPDNEGLFTWWAPWRSLRQRNIGWRIDYVLASASLARRATACAVRAEVGTSDHAPIVADFAPA